MRAACTWARSIAARPRCVSRIAIAAHTAGIASILRAANALKYRLTMITAADVRAVALSLPRTEEHLIRDYTKFRVGKIVYASISPDELMLGFGFPKDERAALVASEQDKFMMPLPSDERYQWVRARLPVLDPEELRELLIDAWCMVVPKKVSTAYLEGQGISPR